MKEKLPISKRQQNFLVEFLATKPLEELLPMYAIAISNNSDIFTFLPAELIERIRQSLKALQNAVCINKHTNKTALDQEKIHRNLKNLSGHDLLSSYFLSATSDDTAYLTIPEPIRKSAEDWLDELRSCVTGKRGLFSNEFEPELFIDEFIQYSGGARVTTILGDSIQGKNADYVFPQDNVIVELKVLETDFWASNAGKLKAAQSEYLKGAKITGDEILGIKPSYPTALFRSHQIILRDALQKITKTANRQIKDTKELLNVSEAKGVVMFLTDGFYSRDPYLIVGALHEPITRQFSGVDAIVFLTFRRKVTLDLGDGSFDYFVWEPRYKKTPPDWFADFIDHLGSLWFQYLEYLSGKHFDRHLLSRDSRNLSKSLWKPPLLEPESD